MNCAGRENKTKCTIKSSDISSLVPLVFKQYETSLWYAPKISFTLILWWNLVRQKHTNFSFISFLMRFSISLTNSFSLVTLLDTVPPNDYEILCFMIIRLTRFVWSYLSKSYFLSVKLFSVSATGCSVFNKMFKSMQSRTIWKFFFQSIKLIH